MECNSKERGDGQAVLAGNSAFNFSCNDGLPCFTQCCRDVNIYLTPYDVLRMRRALKIDSGDFLDRYTRQFVAGGVNVPVVQLAMDPESLSCKLVTPQGCGIYEDRPWACRMFPLDLGGRLGEYCYVEGSGRRCLGMKERSPQKVDEWLKGQGVEKYLEMEALFESIIPPGYAPAARLGAGLGKLMFLAYDLSRFESLLEDKAFVALYGLAEETVRHARENDEEMLLLAFRYIRSQMDELQGEKDL